MRDLAFHVAKRDAQGSCDNVLLAFEVMGDHSRRYAGRASDINHRHCGNALPRYRVVRGFSDTKSGQLNVKNFWHSPPDAFLSEMQNSMSSHVHFQGGHGRATWANLLNFPSCGRSQHLKVVIRGHLVGKRSFSALKDRISQDDGNLFLASSYYIGQANNVFRLVELNRKNTFCLWHVCYVRSEVNFNVLIVKDLVT